MPRFALIAACLVLLPAFATAQEPLGPAHTASMFVAESGSSPTTIEPLERWVEAEAERRAMPAWLKWGLIGGVGLGAASALLSGYGSEIGGPSRGEAAVTGFAVGFVVIGGGVAVYQALCKPDGWSRRQGLCTP